MSIESVNNIDEAMLIGYFASMKSNFLFKLTLFSHFVIPGSLRIDPSKIDMSLASEVANQLDGELFLRALKKGNQELTDNFLDDAVTSLIFSSWSIFEQICKALVNPNYSNINNEMSLCYTHGLFEFSKREKKNIELFYYIRNAICHHNGAYFASKDIDLHYKRRHFKSKGNAGNKISVDPQLSWSVACDLESYTEKAWTNFKKNQS